MSMQPRIAFAALLLAFALAACSLDTHFESPQVQGPVALVTDAGQPRLWVLSKQEETRDVSVGGNGLRDVGDWRTDTFFHFHLQAFDPVTARPLWKRTLLTIGDDEASGAQPSRVVGSAVEAQLLGQDGGTVWLLIGEAPFAVAASDGHVLADADALQARNPQLKGMLPSEAQHYGFDQGLVILAADARQFVVRGPELKASEYSPAPPPAPEPPPMPGSGRRLVEPSRPLAGAPLRLVDFAGRLFGL
jgi:hypothetical protein